MRYRITQHADRRMVERHIVVANVEEVLKNPDDQREDSNQGSVRLERRLPQGVLIVWVVAPWPPIGTAVVKSVAWKE